MYVIVYVFSFTVAFDVLIFHLSLSIISFDQFSLRFAVHKKLILLPCSKHHRSLTSCLFPIVAIIFVLFIFNHFLIHYYASYMQQMRVSLRVIFYQMPFNFLDLKEN